MTERLLPDEMLPVGPTTIYVALRAAWPAVIPDAVSSRGALVLLVSHWALETGFGHAMHRYNIGNKKHVAGDGRDYVQFRCLEYDAAGKPYYVNPPDPRCSFVAFPTLDAGACDYLAGLHRHFGAAWLDVVTDDVPKFCHDLKLKNYYTATEASYVAGVVRCYHQLDSSIPPDTLSELPELGIIHPDVVADEVTPESELPKADA